MTKILSLFDRLNWALPTSTSDTETGEIYALFYRAGSKVVEMSFGEFYEDLKNQSLSPLEGSEKTVYEVNEVNFGKNLSKLLGNIEFPDSGEKHFGAKYKRARNREFNLLREFYRD